MPVIPQWGKLLLAGVAGFLLAVLLLGRYEYVRANNVAVWRMNKLTGGAALCRGDGDGHYRCAWE